MAELEQTRIGIGGGDDDLSGRLDRELTAFNAAATGAGEPSPVSAQVHDSEGELIGGLTAWIWGQTCAVDMLWVRTDRRNDGWGKRLMTAMEAEAVDRGCTDLIVSSFTFQAPDFYRKLGFRETG